MTPVLFESPSGKVPRWRVEQYSDADPTLIRFVKWGRSGAKCLDQVGRWTGSSWDPSRWVPDAKVPRDVMRVVTGELVRREVAR